MCSGNSFEAEPMIGTSLKLANPFRNHSHTANSTKCSANNSRQHGIKSVALSLTPAMVGDLIQNGKQVAQVGGLHRIASLAL